MKRVIAYPAEQMLVEDFLTTQVSAMKDAGRLAQAITGGAATVDGVNCSPTAPASMSVLLSSGSIFFPTIVDVAAFSTLPADASYVVKVGDTDGLVMPIAAPSAAGTEVVYLIQATGSEIDNTPSTLNYFSAANPAVTLSGPGNSGQQQNTRRTCVCSLGLKAGAPAAAGQGQAPGADPGWVPLWLVTVEYGATTIAAGAILAHPQAPRFTSRLTSAPTDLSGYASHGDVAAEAQARSSTDTSLGNGLSGESSARVAADDVIGSRIDALRLGFRDQTILTASGTWTAPAGISVVKATVVGGGAGGGASSGTNAGGGGGAGGTATVYVGVTPGQAIAVSVGAYGPGGMNGGDGGNGGSSSFGQYASGSGGQGGKGGNNGGSGGGGGNGFGNGLDVSGGYGTDASASLAIGGNGGASSLGGGGRASSGAISVENGQAFGSGGGGGYGNTGNAGGSGQQGIVVMEY